MKPKFFLGGFKFLGGGKDAPLTCSDGAALASRGIVVDDTWDPALLISERIRWELRPCRSSITISSGFDGNSSCCSCCLSCRSRRFGKQHSPRWGSAKKEVHQSAAEYANQGTIHSKQMARRCSINNSWQRTITRYTHGSAGISRGRGTHAQSQTKASIQIFITKFI